MYFDKKTILKDAAYCFKKYYNMYLTIVYDIHYNVTMR